MRRFMIEEPYSMAAVWCRRLALFAMVVAGIGIGLVKLNLVDSLSGLAVVSAALVVACLAGLSGLSAFVVIWRTGRRGTGIALGGLVLTGALLALPGYLAFQAIRLPVQNDASTDLVDPPNFSRSSVALAARGGHANGELPQAWREAQRKIWPDVQPVMLDLDIAEAWPLVQAAVTNLRWRVIERQAPGGRQGHARLDAIDFSVLLGFPDDITIRLRPAAGQTRVDIRSASRYGRHDFGVNPKRIEKFAAELQAQLDAR
jgi:uncharacterized protein (DUF1499 family)